jgi:hypothetical protein
MTIYLSDLKPHVKRFSPQGMKFFLILDRGVLQVVDLLDYIRLTFRLPLHFLEVCPADEPDLREFLGSITYNAIRNGDPDEAEVAMNEGAHGLRRSEVQGEDLPGRLTGRTTSPHAPHMSSGIAYCLPSRRRSVVSSSGERNA